MKIPSFPRNAHTSNIFVIIFKENTSNEVNMRLFIICTEVMRHLQAKMLHAEGAVLWCHVCMQSLSNYEGLFASSYSGPQSIIPHPACMHGEGTVFSRCRTWYVCVCACVFICPCVLEIRQSGVKDCERSTKSQRCCVEFCCFCKSMK